MRKKAIIAIVSLLTFTAGAWADDVVWPGTIGSMTLNNTSLSNKYYPVSSVANLNDLAVYVNGQGTYSTGGDEETAHHCEGLTFKVTNDITFGSSDVFTPIGYGDNLSGVPFKGTFDGGSDKGFTISGINVVGIEGVGLFGYVHNPAIIKNVKLDNSTFIGDAYVGGIVGNGYGYGASSTPGVFNCEVTNKVNVTANDVFAGGIVGVCYYQNISGCTSAATVIGNDCVGGIVGGIQGYNAGGGKKYGKMEDCSYKGNSVTGGSEAKEVGAVIGDIYVEVGGSAADVTITDNTYNKFKENIYGIGGTTVAVTEESSEVTVTTEDNLDEVKPITDILIDGTANSYLIAHHAANSNLKMMREFMSGMKYTVCLPFDPSALLTKGNVWTFTGISDGKAVMTTQTSPLEANKPYIFQPSSDLDIIDFGNVTISKESDPKITGDGFAFKGTYDGMSWTEAVESQHVYGFAATTIGDFAQGAFVRLGRGVTAAPFRAYLEYTGEGEINGTQTQSARQATRTSLPNVIGIEWRSQADATAIKTVDALQSEEAWYSIDGRRLEGKPTARGIYIRSTSGQNNGKKVMVK